MPGSEIIKGHARQVLFSRVGSEATQGDSVDFGQFDVGLFSRLTGQVFTDSGGLTLRWRYGVGSGSFQVTSTTVISLGVFDEINYGRFVDFSFTPINSTSTYAIQIFGEPLR